MTAVVASVSVLSATGVQASASAPAPRVYLPQCPGVSQPLQTSSFPTGTYDLTSDYATFDPATLTVRANGTTTKVTTKVDNDAPQTFEVDATSQSDDTATYSFESRLQNPPLGYDLNGNTYEVFGGCLGPADTVTVSTNGSAVAPSSITADADGNIAFAPRVTARTSRTKLTVTATDSASGRSEGGTFPVPATTLPAAEQLSSAAMYAYQELYSPNLTYELGQHGCTAELQHFYTVDKVRYSPTIWDVGTGSSFGSCRLRLLRNGDLELRTASGRRLWHSGTRTTGSNNRLVVLNDGNIALRTAAGHPVWTSRTGLIRGPNGYTTKAAITSTRNGNSVDITGALRQYTVNGTLTRGSGRVVDLEREVGRTWQVYRSKPANSAGHVNFSFWQSSPQSYRLDVASTRQLAATLSRTVRR